MISTKATSDLNQGNTQEGRPDGELSLGLGSPHHQDHHPPSKTWGQQTADDGGGGGGRGEWSELPSPGAETLAAAARGGGGGQVGGGDWGEGTNHRGVAEDPSVPASAPPGWRGGSPGTGAASAAAAAAASHAVPGSRSVILGIPTVPRPQGVNYLEQTLQAVLAQTEVEKQVS